MFPFKLLAALATASVLVACSSTAVVVPTGGSRADGVIRLSFEYSDMKLSVPKIDADQALASAKARCAAWNYTGAEPFGGHTTVCSAPSFFGGCGTWTMTVTYQCTGNPSPSR